MLTIMRMVVVLPLPLGPMKPKTLPSGTVRERSSTAVTSPKVLVTSEISTAGISVRGAWLQSGIRRRLGEVGASEVRSDAQGGALCHLPYDTWAPRVPTNTEYSDWLAAM